MPRPKKSESNQVKSKKAVLLEVAIDLFSRNGFHGVSIRDIAKGVGIKESSIYNHYGSKDEILSTIFDLFQLELEKSVPNEADLSELLQKYRPEEFLKIGLRRFREHVQDPSMEKISQIIITEMFHDERARDIAMKEYFTRQQAIVEKIFGNMMDIGQIHRENSQALADAYSYAMLSMQIEYSLLKSWGLDTETVENKMERLLDFLVGIVDVKRRSALIN